MYKALRSDLLVNPSPSLRGAAEASALGDEAIS